MSLKFVGMVVYAKQLGVGVPSITCRGLCWDAEVTHPTDLVPTDLVAVVIPTDLVTAVNNPITALHVALVMQMAPSCMGNILFTCV